MTLYLPPRAFALRTASFGLLSAIRRHLARTNAAFAAQRRLATIQPETLRDTGCSVEDLTGDATHAPALPFFMQAGFGRDAR